MLAPTPSLNENVPQSADAAQGIEDGTKKNEGYCLRVISAQRVYNKKSVPNEKAEVKFSEVCTNATCSAQ